MLETPDICSQLDSLGVERIQAPFMIEGDGTDQECYYGEVFGKCSLRGTNPNFNIVPRRHYSLLKNSGRAGVYSLGS